MPAAPVVLLIEDHTELGHVIRDVMDAEGYDVIAVRDQFAAVATLRRQTVDLVIADLPDPDPGQPDPLVEITRDYGDIPLIVVKDELPEDIPFLGPWHRDVDRVTLRRPFKLDDLMTVTREVVG